MRRFAAPESHFDLDFVALFQESAGGPHPDLKIVVVGARAYPHFLNLGDMLVFLRVAGSLVGLEFEFPEVGNTAHGRLGRGGNLNEVQPRLFGTPDGFFGRHDADLLALSVEDPHFGDAYLAIGPRTSGCGWPRNEWWARNRRSPS